MKLKQLTVEDFINEVDSKRPAPGGGSVSALASSIGIALTRMVGHLTVGKKKFKALDQEVQDKFNKVITEFENTKEVLVDLIDKDTEAFNLIMAAFKLPKETDEDQAIRKQKILEGTIEAIKVPMQVALTSKEALDRLDVILEYGNKNTLSDLGVSTLMLAAGIEGAIMNVKINIPGLTNEKERTEYVGAVEDILAATHETRDRILSKIHSKL